MKIPEILQVETPQVRTTGAKGLIALERIRLGQIVFALSESGPRILIALILVVAQHSFLGLRVVVEDYVHHPGTRIAILLRCGSCTCSWPRRPCSPFSQ